MSEQQSAADSSEVVGTGERPKKLTPAQAALLAKLYSGHRVRWHESESLGRYAGRVFNPNVFRLRDETAHVACATTLLKRGLIEEESRDDYGPICRISAAGIAAYMAHASPADAPVDVEEQDTGPPPPAPTSPAPPEGGEPQARVEVVPAGDEWRVEFKVGTQTFRIGSETWELREEAEWYRERFTEALSACTTVPRSVTTDLPAPVAPEGGGAGEPQSDAFTMLQEALRKGEASDGYHTHRELYEYRMLYNAHAAHGWLAAGVPVVKSLRHSDGEPCFGGGSFIVVAQLPTGQVSNHYREEHWDLFRVPAVETPPPYDGHTPAEAAERLRAALPAPAAAPVEPESGGGVCHDCDRPYAAFPDLMVSHRVWKAIGLTHREKLCPSCISNRCEAAGLTNVLCAFASGPLVGIPHPVRREPLREGEDGLAFLDAAAPVEAGERQRALEAALRAVEWSRPGVARHPWNGSGNASWVDTCPSCRQARDAGHAPSCQLAAALAAQPPASPATGACGGCRPEYGDCLNAGCYLAAAGDVVRAARALDAEYRPGAKADRMDYRAAVTAGLLHNLHVAVANVPVLRAPVTGEHAS